MIRFQLVFLISLFIVSCNNDPIEDPVNVLDEIELNLVPTYQGNALELEQIFQTDEGYDIKFTRIKCYLQNFGNSNGILRDATLFDFDANGSSLFRIEGDYSKWSNLDLNIGIDAITNHEDPALPPLTSPLNIMNANDMHWGWNPGYIFVKIEGKADTIPDGNALFDHNFVFHVGKDQNLRSLSLQNIDWVNVGENLHSASIELDLYSFLTGDNSHIDLKTEYSSHSSVGQEVLTEKVADNFKYAFSNQ